MKVVIVCLVLMFLFAFKFGDTKMELLCQKWQEVGAKHFGKEYKVVDKSMSETLLINSDYTFEKVVYGQLKFKGKWKFNKDHSILAFAITEMNGNIMENMTIEQSNPTDSIIRITKDTLIIGGLKYYGPKKIYGHDDRYYVRYK